ncbi:hypothetical protein Ddye_025715 [Dipteronia dyeriana]|uniref:Reverse transcriptase zinc-binding domain-containing protein n=1 Tax=Dipteronia dyeriana TaxID=168575 RepID=A0AAD9WPV4_9ROSI|nr:hypothetical protein Ddye_025715 [Dipteronia dyeriana]
MAYWWKNFWKLNVPSKIKVFLWKVCHDWIPTNFNLARRRVHIDGLCSFYKISMETTFHALWECNRLKKTRREWLVQVSAIGVDPNNFFDYIFNYFYKISRDQKELFCVVVWRIWFGRNSHLYGSMPVDLSDTIRWSKKFLQDYQSANDNRRKISDKE